MEIKAVRVTPMQRVLVKFTAAEPAPLKYQLVFQSKSRDFEKSFEVDSSSDFLSTQLPAPDIYTLALTAVYDDAENNTSVESEVTVSPENGFSPQLRQSIFDILLDAKVKLRGRSVYLFHRDFEPMTFRKSSVSAVPTPLIEVGMPMLRRSEMESNVRNRDEWTMDIRVLDDGQEENYDTLKDLWLLSDTVRAVINNVDYLNLSRRGVLNKSWEWKIKEDPESRRDRLTGLVMNLRVFVEQPI